MRSRSIFNKTILVLSILLLFFSLVNFGFGEVTTLKAASGGAGGGWFVNMSGIAEFVKNYAPEINIKVTPGGGLANPPRVSENESQLGFSFPYVIQMALEGTGLYAGTAYPDIRAIGSLGGADYDQFVIVQDVAQDKKISSVDDIFQNKIPLNFGFIAMGDTLEFKTRLLLGHYGLTYDDLKSWGAKIYHGSFSDLVKLMKDRQIEVVYVGGSLPTSCVTEINVGRPIKVIPFPKGYIDMMVEKYSFVEGIIPKGTYSDTAVPADIPTLNCLNILMVNKNVPDDIVYTIAKTMGDHKEIFRSISNYYIDYDPAISWNCGVPLHPGAEKYYKEEGYMK